MKGQASQSTALRSRYTGKAFSGRLGTAGGLRRNASEISCSTAKSEPAQTHKVQIVSGLRKQAHMGLRLSPKKILDKD